MEDNYLDANGITHLTRRYKEMFAPKGQTPSAASVEFVLPKENWVNHVYTINDTLFMESSTLVCDLVIPVNATKEEVKELKENYSLIYSGETFNTKAELYAVDNPTVDLTVQMIVPISETIQDAEESVF